MALTVYGSPYVDGTDLIANYPAASLTVAQSIDSAGYFVGRGINAQTGSMTTVLTDAGKTITMSNASANTVTIPANSSVAYVIGTRINILNLGAGACTPTAAAGVTINGTITALATNSSASVIKTATNTWSYVPFGSGAPTLTSADVTSTTGSPTITTSGIYTIYKFTGSGTIVLGKAGLCDVLGLGGGGGGGMGGGGAGGLTPGTTLYLPTGTNTITVGAGGAGAINSGQNSRNGATSLISTYAFVGGGGGGAVPDLGGAYIGFNGGSGGGSYQIATVGTGVPTQGSDGGTGTGSAGGGGGGASAVGANAIATTGGAGGAGTANSITGASITYAGGGGAFGVTVAGAGGAGGGAAGKTSGTGNAGTINLGGGGGGTNGAFVAGAGGSGIVIVRVVT